MNYKSEVTKQTNNPGKLLLALIGGILFISVLIFLFSGNPSGWQVIFSQGAGYIFGMLFLFAVALLAIFGAYQVYSKAQDTTKGFWALIFVSVVFFAIAFGKGCTDKANGGVTGPRGAPTAQTLHDTGNV